MMDEEHRGLFEVWFRYCALDLGLWFRACWPSKLLEGNSLGWMISSVWSVGARVIQHLLRFKFKAQYT